jgi:hypothetical protein
MTSGGAISGAGAFSGRLENTDALLNATLGGGVLTGAGVTGAVFSGRSANIFDALNADPFVTPSRALSKFQVGDVVMFMVDLCNL